jgi:hypothetical protein
MVALATSKTLTFLSILIVTLSVILQALAPDFVGTIDPASVRHELGLAYTVKLKRTSPSAFWNLAAGDKSGAPSKLVLFEDGQQLSQAHALHDDIRLLGKGRYSHWSSALYFSSTDATAPSRGLHVYSFRVPQGIPAWLKSAALGCAVVLLLQGLFVSKLAWQAVVSGMEQRENGEPRFWPALGVLLIVCTVLGWIGAQAIFAVPAADDFCFGERAINDGIFQSVVEE